MGERVVWIWGECYGVCTCFAGTAEGIIRMHAVIEGGAKDEGEQCGTRMVVVV